MSGPNPIDSLPQLSRVSDAEAAAVFSIAGREELLDGVTDLPLGRRPRRAPHSAPRRRLVFAVAVVAVMAVGTAAGWAVLHGPAHETTSVQCQIDGSDTVIPSSSGDPAHDCAVQYERDNGTKPPALVAYDNSLGGVTVLARSQTPPKGWTVLQSQDVALIELQDSLDDYIGGLNSGCLDAKAATALANAKLARFGFRDWSVTVRDAPGACVSGDVVDPTSRTVTLIPSEAQTGPQTALFAKLADKLRPITQSCERLPAAVAAANEAATSVGLSAGAKTYELNAVTDNTLRCASVYETVGGTIFITVRGPGG